MYIKFKQEMDFIYGGTTGSGLMSSPGSEIRLHNLYVWIEQSLEILSSRLPQHPNRFPGVYEGRVKLMVLSEDRLQIKWKEADGPVQGYKVRMRPISGEPLLPFMKCGK